MYKRETGEERETPEIRKLETMEQQVTGSLIIAYNERIPA